MSIRDRVKKASAAAAKKRLGKEFSIVGEVFWYQDNSYKNQVWRVSSLQRVLASTH